MASIHPDLRSICHIEGGFSFRCSLLLVVVRCSTLCSCCQYFKVWRESFVRIVSFMHLPEQGVRKLACSAIIICYSFTWTFDWISPSTLLLHAAAWNKVYCDGTSCCCCPAVVNLLQCFPPSALPSTCNLLRSKLPISCHLLLTTGLQEPRLKTSWTRSRKQSQKRIQKQIWRPLTMRS